MDAVDDSSKENVVDVDASESNDASRGLKRSCSPICPDETAKKTRLDSEEACSESAELEELGGDDDPTEEKDSDEKNDNDEDEHEVVTIDDDDENKRTPHKRAARSASSAKKPTPKTTKEEREAERLKRLEQKEEEQRQKEEQRRIREEERLRIKAEKERQAEEKRLEKEKKDREREEKRKEEERKKEERRKEEEERKERKRKEEEEKMKKKKEEEEKREAKRKEEEEKKEAKRREEEEKKEAKRKEELALEEKKKRESNRFKQFFKKVDAGDETTSDASKKKLVAPSMRRDPIENEKKEELFKLLANPDETITIASYLQSDVCKNRKLVLSRRVKNRAKLFEFSDNCRPPYYGTWNKKISISGKGKKCFAHDPALDYEVDSDAEWEEEPSDAEECKSDEEDEGEDIVDSDNEEFFVEPGYLSDGEGADDESPANPSENAEERRARLAARAQEWNQDVQRRKQVLVSRIFAPSLPLAPPPTQALRAVLL